MGHKEINEVEQWREEAEALPGEAILTLPRSVLLDEAVQVAGFLRTYWKPRIDPSSKRVIRPGLAAACKKNEKGIKLRLELADDIESLQRAVQKTHSSYLLCSRGQTPEDHYERAEFLVGEIKSALEWLFDDGVEDENDAQLARVKDAHANDDSSAADLALALADYTALAEPHRDELDGLGGFDVAMLDEAKTLAHELRASKTTLDPEVIEKAKATLRLRDQLSVLLMQRVGRVRAAARFVFRHHPEIQKLATSAYERRRRAESRRAKKKQEAATRGA